MSIQRFNIAQDLPGFLDLLGGQQSPPHQKGNGAARVHHVAANPPVQIFFPGDMSQHFGGGFIGQPGFQHPPANRFQRLVNAFQSVGGIFGIGRIQF